MDYDEGFEFELHAWDPKDGDLYLNRLKLCESVMEGRRRSDVQIDV